jgi:crotonobetainyl-CoA:carnitine CoA-transferase CaiB-like acyl-CoA transferase
MNSNLFVFMTLPLEGIRVLDLSRLLPGPFATMILADFGAEVIKVESPIQGDYMRWWPPFYTKDTNKESATFLHLNRNKKSIILNLKDAEGQEIFYRLAKKSDIVFESFRPGVMNKLKIDYDTISKINPQIIYCSLSGYGQNGPYKDLPGHDVNYLGVAGVGSLTGEPDHPKLIGVQIADIGAGGLNAVLAILMSIIVRNKTGRGQYIDVSMLDGSMTWLAFAFPRYLASKEIPMRGDDLLTGGRPGYGIYKTKDNKFVAVGALEKKFWMNLCTTIKREDLIESTDMEKKEIVECLKSVMLTKTREEWFEISKQTDICISPVYELNEIAEDPQVQAREMIVDFEDERFGNIKYIGMPFKLSETPGSIRTRAPGYGEHTEEILRSLNYSDQEIETFHKNAVINSKKS